MIILDTNILSEFTRPTPDSAVLAWLDAQNSADMWTTAITEAEMLAGLALIPLGKRKAELSSAIEKALAIFEDRILPFDSDAARHLPDIALQRRAARLPSAGADSQIAAIARARSATVATRNVADFEHCGIHVVNPWAAKP